MLQQSHESAPDVTRMARGRKAVRTHDGLMRDDMRELSASRHDNAQSSGLPARWEPDEHCEPRLEYYRPRFTDEEDRKTRVSRRETSGSGAQHPTARRAPSPHMQHGGRDYNNVDINPVANSQESFR
jgi:hypothetical protein